MNETALLIARLQFALNISFHILFPAINIALAWFLVGFKWAFHWTGQQYWKEAYQFWVKVFALSFALGVVSGVVMSFQFGTNWPGFMLTIGAIAGPLLAYEILTAFFMEATFLGIMLFGQHKVSPWIHTLATTLVAIGTTLSAFWIVALNSWMHTPAGYVWQDGHLLANNWREIVFSPSMPLRFLHIVIASGLTAAFLIMGISAYQWQRKQHSLAVQASFKAAIYVAAVLAPLQAWVGDLQGLNTLRHQPAKVAAIEALWESRSEVPLVLFGWPDASQQKNHYELAIPKLGSLILTHRWDGFVQGLDAFPNEHPPVAPVFWSFRIMVGMGLLMWFMAWGAAYDAWRYTVPRLFWRRILIGATFSGWVANLAGWYVTEIGRQPYLVQGILRVRDAVSHNATGVVLSSLIVYSVVYTGLLISYIAIIFLLARQARSHVQSTVA